MESREQRIAALAATLRSSGIAKSDSQAKMMAEDMVGVEEHVQKSYEVEHAKAHEYLQTAKNLGIPRQTIKQESKPEVRQESKQEPTKKVEPITDSRTNPKTVSEYTDVNFGGKTLNQAFDHNTHNSALEAIKAKVSRNIVIPIEDMYGNEDSTREDDVQEEHENIANINTADLNPKSEPLTSAKLSEIRIKDESAFSEVDELLEAPEQIAPEQAVEEDSEERFEDEESIGEEFTDEEFLEKESLTDALKDEPVEKETVVEELVDEPKLDAQRLVDMMEEDGKLEEHTREIKEKPKDVKPKEAYEENNIDLGSMFDFNKGQIRK